MSERATEPERWTEEQLEDARQMRDWFAEADVGALSSALRRLRSPDDEEGFSV